MYNKLKAAKCISMAHSLLNLPGDSYAVEDKPSIYQRLGLGVGWILHGLLWTVDAEMKDEVRHSKLVYRCMGLGISIPKDIQELAEEFYKCVEVYPEDFSYPTPDISINDMKHIVDDFYCPIEDAVVQEILADNPEWYNESASRILYLYTHKKGVI